MSAQTHRYQNLQVNMPAIKELAEAIVSAQFFKAKTKHVALIIAVELFVTGESPMEYQRRNGFVGNTPYTPYDAMIAAFQEAGGKLKLVSKTADLAAVELTYDGEKTPFSLSWEDAQKEAFCYDGKTEVILKTLAAGKTPSLKPKYATPRSRAIMLYARLIDDAIRSVAAGVNFGRYTAEVIEDIPADELPAATSQSQAAAQSQTTQAAPSQASQTQRPTQQTPPVNNVVQPGQQPPATGPESGPVVEAVQPEVETSNASELSVATGSSDAMKVHVSDPCTDLHRKKILELIAQFAQQGQPEVKESIVDRLRAAGLPNLNALTITEAEDLIHALEAKQIKTWIDSEVEGHMSRNQASGNALSESTSTSQSAGNAQPQA